MQQWCKNCRYYSPFEEEKEKGFGNCNCSKFKYEGAYNWKEKGLEKDNLLYMDYEWYNASIEVGEEFGCIHFRAEE